MMLDASNGTLFNGGCVVASGAAWATAHASLLTSGKGDRITRVWLIEQFRCRPTSVDDF